MYMARMGHCEIGDVEAPGLTPGTRSAPALPGLEMPVLRNDVELEVHHKELRSTVG